MSSRRSHPLAVVVVKAVHTLVFLGELSAILWLVVSGLLRRRDRTVAVAAAAVAGEAAVFVANGGVCPLTPLTERLGAERGGVSDIFLPNAVARAIPIWSTALLVVAAALHLRGTSGGRIVTTRCRKVTDSRRFASTSIAPSTRCVARSTRSA